MKEEYKNHFILDAIRLRPIPLRRIEAEGRSQQIFHTLYISLFSTPQALLLSFDRLSSSLQRQTALHLPTSTFPLTLNLPPTCRILDLLLFLAWESVKEVSADLRPQLS